MILVPAIKRGRDNFTLHSIWLNPVEFEQENFDDGIIFNCQISPAQRKLTKLLLPVSKMPNPKPKNSAETSTLTSPETELSKKFSLLLNPYFSKQGRLFQFKKYFIHPFFKQCQYLIHHLNFLRLQTLFSFAFYLVSDQTLKQSHN